ncbi:uncharacterized protein [Rutidosis leptorrhynchoides]|uniref:uncharacterized protein n=1 Tax=Rutidosis leptorrhynchoides TaxID=125765 RepID=UPI003A9922D6
MQRERDNRDARVPHDRFDGDQGFTSRRSMISSLLGGRDPFDDPFFTRPFGSLFEPSVFDTHSSFDALSHTNDSSSKGLVIEELDSDDESEIEKGGNGDFEVKDNKARKGPLVEHPDDDEVKDVSINKNYNRVEGTKSQSQSVSFKKVTYGGINGAYYTATTARKSGSDGVVLEDSKEADKTTGRATHRISKGIHDKGHSVTRKLGTDGTVDTVQTLHNLEEDELSGFDEAWNGNADRHLPGWNEDFNLFGRAGIGSSLRPFGLGFQTADRSHSSGGVNNDNVARTSSSSGRPKKVVTINIE